MIEVDSCYPADWSHWNSSSSHPYLELYGEADPYICTNLTETLTAHSTNNDPQMKAEAPIYEYFWTIGISEHLYEKFAHHDQNTGAEVTLYFPLTGGWRAESVVASIKYVRPLPHRDDLVKKVAEYWDTVAPTIGKVAELTTALPLPGVSTAATLINTLSKIPITSLPPVDGLSWSVTKVTGYINAEFMDGVKWTLPKKLFTLLGTRLTGSIAVYFHPAQIRQRLATANNQAILQQRPMLAQAVVYDDGRKVPLVEREGEDAVALDIRPRPWGEAVEG